MGKRMGNGSLRKAGPKAKFKEEKGLMRWN